jgi:hypothetical protein
MTEQFWLGPTYQFHSGQWLLSAGVPAEEGRLEWLLRRVEEGVETVSHSFVLDPGASGDDLRLALGDLPPEVMTDLVDQANAQTDPRLLLHHGDSGLA